MIRRFGAIALCATVASSAFAADVVVQPGQSLQAAIDAASAGDRLLVQPGVYPEAIRFAGKNIEVIGVGGAAVTTIDATGIADSTVTFDANEPLTAKLVGFTIRGGSGSPVPPFTSQDPHGGGIVAWNGAKATVEACVVEDNTAVRGGGVYDSIALGGFPAAALVLKDCTLRNNAASKNGGGAAGAVKMYDCVIEANHAGEHGGGMDYPAYAERCEFISNSAQLSGGGAYVSKYGLSADPFKDCSFVANTALVSGGGVYLQAPGTLATAIMRCEFRGNSAPIGGGLWAYLSPSDSLYTGTIRVESCVFAGNSSTSGGDGYDLGLAPLAKAKVIGCTFYGDQLAAGMGSEISTCIFAAVPGALVVPGSAPMKFSVVPSATPGLGNYVGDPQLVDPANGDFRPAPGSPCIDAGDTTLAPATVSNGLDAAATQRMQHGRVDVGALEFAFDCDGNGAADWLEVKSGAAADSDGDTIINVCEGQPDCDGNGIGDGFQIAAQPTLDQDSDGSLDACQYLVVPGEFATIQAAIDAAQDGDAVVVADGIWQGAGNRDLDLKGKAITVRSFFGPRHCVIDCGAQGRGFTIASATPAAAVIEGFTIRNGFASEGGGILVAGAGAFGIRRCVIEHCQASGNGGGIALVGPAEPILDRCLIRKNVATSAGGGVHATAGAVISLNQCTVAGNASPIGGGLAADGDADAFSAGTILAANQSPSARDVALSGAGTSLAIANSLVSGGQSAVLVTGGATLQWNPGNIGANPQFVDQQGGDYHLTATSPAIDLGPIDGLDFEGDAALGAPDMGADEFQRHLWSTGELASGATYSLRIAGPPGTAFALLLLSPAQLLPAKKTWWGPFHLGLPVIVLSLPGPPASGVLSLDTVLPPGLPVGVTLYGQAFLGAPTEKLTNLWKDSVH